jgi:hypothetical protein
VLCVEAYIIAGFWCLARLIFCGVFADSFPAKAKL